MTLPLIQLPGKACWEEADDVSTSWASANSEALMESEVSGFGLAQPKLWWAWMMFIEWMFTLATTYDWKWGSLNIRHSVTTSRILFLRWWLVGLVPCHSMLSYLPTALASQMLTSSSPNCSTLDTILIIDRESRRIWLNLLCPHTHVGDMEVVPDSCFKITSA